MLTPNGGVFGRNPTFNDVTVDGNLTVNGDIALGDDIVVADSLTVQGTEAATSTTTGALRVAGGISTQDGLYTGTDAFINGARVGIGPAGTGHTVLGANAGALLNSASLSSIAIGANSLDAVSASRFNVAIGENALTALTSGAESITNTTPGTGGAAGSYSGVVLVVESGGTMTVAPTVTLTVNASGNVSAISITSPGSGASVQSGIVFSATPTAGVPSDWRGTLASLTGLCTAIGRGVLAANTNGSRNVGIGFSALLSNVSGSSNVGIGSGALQNATGSNNVAIGDAAMSLSTTGASNVGIGLNALRSGGSRNIAIGQNAMLSASGTNNTAIGNAAGDVMTTATDCVIIGYNADPAANSNTNSIVIGASATGDGSNTTVIGNTSTTSTRIAGTATSVFAISGDTMRITGTRTPASNAAGTAGDFTFGTDGATTYLYYCIASGNWGRVALTTGY